MEQGQMAFILSDTGGQAALYLTGKNHLQVVGADRNGNGKRKSDLLRESATQYGHFAFDFKMPVSMPPGLID